MTSLRQFERTFLWRNAFVDPRRDATVEEQEFFRTQYLLLRDKVELLVSRIPVDIRDLTVHDVTHLDALWGTASLVSEAAVDLNPPEAFVFGASVLLHDAGMSLAAFPNGFEDVKKHIVWKDAVARLLLTDPDVDAVELQSEDPSAEVARRILPSVLRRIHAQHAEQLAEQAWWISGEQTFLIDIMEVRHFYGQTIGKIAHSHWWPVHELELELSGDLGAMPHRTQGKVDRVKVACLLRVADALHLDSRRAPSFLRAIVRPQGIAELH